jgi:hypothetical protein
VRQHLDNFKRGLNQTLLPKKKQSKPESKDPCKAMLKILLLFLKQNLRDAFSSILIA